MIGQCKTILQYACLDCYFVTLLRRIFIFTHAVIANLSMLYYKENKAIVDIKLPRGVQSHP